MKRLLLPMALIFALHAPASAQPAATVDCASQGDPLLCKVTIAKPASGDLCKAPLPDKVILGPRTLRLRWVVDGDRQELRFRRNGREGVVYRNGGDAFSAELGDPDTNWHTRRKVRTGKVDAEAVVNLVANGANCPEAGPVAVIRD